MSQTVDALSVEPTGNTLSSDVVLTLQMQQSAKQVAPEQVVEAALLQNLLVDDCVVLVRETATSQRELVAYVSSGLSPEKLQSHLQTVLPAAWVPSAYVPVSSLPLTPTGQVDKQALSALEVCDADLVRHLEQRMQSVPEVEQVAVVVQEDTERLPPLHLSLFPDWKTASETSQDAIATPKHLVPIQQQESKVLAITHGGVQSEHGPTTLPSALQRTALQAAEKGIIYLQSDGSEIVQSYSDLLEEAERILAGLRRLSLKPQDQVIFQLDQNHDFIPAFWGCVLGGFVPVPISIAPNYGTANNTVNKLHNAWQMLERPLILTSKELGPAVRSLSDFLGLENFQVATMDELRSCSPDHSWHISQPDDLAVLILTSGSTGMPKGVMLSHRNILSNVAASAQMNDFKSEDTSLNWLNLDHVGSLIRCSIRDIYVGSQQIHAPAAAVLESPLKWLDWIERYQVTFAWAPNFALGLVNAQAEVIGQRQWDLSRVKSLLSVAEAIVPKTAKRFLELLSPHGLSAHAMHAAWGMSETCAAVTFSHSYLLDLPSDDYAFVEVGAPIPGFHMRIVDEQNQVVSEETLGHLQISGPMITCGYYQNPELNREAFTEDGWLKTGDLGFLRGGRLTVTGRQKDVIVINGLNHHSHEIEAVVEAVEGVAVSYTAACAVRDPESDTDQLVIFFHSPVAERDRLALIQKIRGNVVRQVGVNPAYLIPVAKETIPKTAIGKIQRTQLKQRFEAGEFDSMLKQLDILSGNGNTLPDWFYRKIWCRKEAVTLATQSRTGQTLVFLDQLGLGLRLCAELERLQVPYIAITAGTEFAQLSANRYCIDPRNPVQYCQLLESIATATPIEQILHLWTYDEYRGEVSSLEGLEQAQDKGVYSLLSLVQALSQVQDAKTNVRLCVISSYTQPIREDAIAYENTPLLGLIKTIPQEMPWLDCRHIDLAAQADTNTASVLRELQVVQREREVAYRDGQRFIPRLEKVNMCHQQQSPFKRGGMYLLSGGLGEIGVKIAKYLLQNYQVRLLLVGRTPLPKRSKWEVHLRQGDDVSRRIQAYLSLEQLGDVVYESVDICELTRLQQVVDRVKSYWRCELDGVIHLAGIGQERLLVEETRDSLAATLRPKLMGTWVLHQLLKQPDSVFISFSSVISWFGVFNVGAYAAANSFLDGFWHHQRYQTGLRSYCFGSSTWAGVGISRGYEHRDSRLAQGREVMSVEQGLNSFLASLHQKPAHLIVGLNGNDPHVRRHTNNSYCVQKISAYFTAGDRPVDLKDLNVRDRFGTPVRCNFQQLQQLPLTDTGEIDRLVAGISRRPTADLAPRTELERQLARIWQEVLGIAQVGIHDNFFELGGSSLRAVRLFSELEREFGQKLPLASLLQAPTIEQMAGIVGEDGWAASWNSLVPIQAHGTKRPFFAIHGGFGNVLFYHNLARYLDSSQPFYGLQAQGLDGKRPPLTRIEDMATHYLQEIRVLQPEGPYLLGGYSFGGAVAFEMAQQLYAQGQQVALLALFDPFGPEFLKPLPLHVRTSKHLRKFLQLKPQAKLAYIQERLTKRFKPSSSYLPPTTYAATFRAAHSQAYKNYMPQVYPGKAILFRASQLAGEWIEWCQVDPTLGWGKLAAGGLQVYDVPGNHDNMLNEPHVQGLAEKLRLCLDGADID